MAAKTYAVMNGAAPGAAAPVPITTGTAIKTMLQLATNTTTVTFPGCIPDVRVSRSANPYVRPAVVRVGCTSPHFSRYRSWSSRSAG